MQKITESQLLEKVKGLREYLVIAEAGDVQALANAEAKKFGRTTPNADDMRAAQLLAKAPGAGQKGPTVAAAQGKDPSNPLNQAPAAGASAQAAPAPYNAAKDSQAANVAMAPGAGAGRGGQGGPTAAELAGASAQAKWPTTDAEIKAFQKANGLTPDGMIGNKTLGALKAKGLTPPAGFQPVGNKAPAAPVAGASAQAAPAGQELRTPAEIAASQDLLTANDGSTTSGAAPAARNPNAGLTPDDPRWQGPKPAAGVNAQGQNVTIKNPDGSTTNPETGVVTPAAGASAQAAPAKPAGAPNPWQGKDPAKAAAWAKLSPAQQKWLGGADPTDQFILARAPKAESVSYGEDQALARIIELARR